MKRSISPVVILAAAAMFTVGLLAVGNNASALAMAVRHAPKELLLPANVSNIPMSISGDQEGTATYDLDNGMQVTLTVASGTTSNSDTNGGVTYNVSYGTMQDAVSDTYVEVTATDGFGNPVHQLLKKVTINISGLSLPSDLSPLYISGLNDGDGNSWTEVPDATFDATAGAATFQTDLLTRFAAFDRSRYAFKAPASDSNEVTPPAPPAPPIEQPTVLGKIVYADGTLIRGSDMKIYVLVNGTKAHIHTLAELFAKYRGQEILNVADGVIEQY